tara:strand:+ start:10206 stop:10508 length:303 start_codon:yes stop_codon:yes gene_type:complete
VLKTKLTGDLDLSDLKKEIDSFIKDLSKQTIRVARQNTPIDTGRARKGWTRSNSRQGFEVENSVPYIGFLEKGISKQAPKGILKPTVRKVTGNIQRRITR